MPFLRSATLEEELNERNKILADVEASLRDEQLRRQEDTAEAQARIADLTEINAQVIFSFS